MYDNVATGVHPTKKQPPLRLNPERERLREIHSSNHSTEKNLYVIKRLLWFNLLLGLMTHTKYYKISVFGYMALIYDAFP